MNYKNVCDKYGEEVGLKVLDFIEEGWGENGCDEFKLDGVSVLKEVVEEFVKEICYNNSMKEVIKEEIEKLKNELEKDGVEWKEEDVRLCVYEDLRDCLKVEMSDVSY